MVYPAGVYLFKVNNENTRTICEICSVLTLNAPERRQRRGPGVLVFNLQQIPRIVLVFYLLTLNK